MSKRKKYTAEEKAEIVLEYLNTNIFMNEVLKKYSISHETLFEWRRKYESFGIDGLKERSTPTYYPEGIKEIIVKEYLRGEHSSYEIARKYGLSTKSMLLQWVKKYNKHRETSELSKGINKSMTIKKITSLKDKLKIVRYCINNNNDYNKTAKLYEVSYQQVYQWVNKYKNGGQDALIDRRGRNKKDDQLTNEEKHQREIKRLSLENERLRAENEFLKKLEELERRR